MHKLSTPKTIGNFTIIPAIESPFCGECVNIEYDLSILRIGHSRPDTAIRQLPRSTDKHGNIFHFLPYCLLFHLDEYLSDVGMSRPRIR